MRKNLVRIVISALIVIAAVLIFIFKPDFTKAAWYNSSWDYRKRLTINGTTDGVQTNYQMKLTVYKSAGSDSGGTVYLGTNVKDDFSDLRFTKSDGTTPLDYWIASYTSGTSAVVWIECDSIPASPSTATFYMYYGNAAATAGSSASATLLTYASSGGTIATIDGTQGPYIRIHKFVLADSGTNLVVTAANSSVSALVIGGGGGSGRGDPSVRVVGGGGAGGYLEGSISVSVGNIAVTVGSGGNGGAATLTNGSAGGNSVFNGATANGGGAGGYNSDPPARNGGSGGGGNYVPYCCTKAYGTATQGNSGGLTGYGYAGGAFDTGDNYYAGGGGGAGGAGSHSTVGTGGIGRSSSITGSPVTYAVGGNSTDSGSNPVDADKGFGGNSFSNATCNGGSGVVIVRYQFRNYTANEPTWGAWGSEESRLPTVTTQIASSILYTTATANGNITDAGKGNATVRGFKYGLTQTNTWSTTENGSFGTGAFTGSITGLAPGTRYYIRAYTTNSAGTSYGAYQSFITAIPSWYNSSWSYRKKLNITGSTDGDQNNYQMKLIIHRSAGTDSGSDVYVGTKCDSTYKDIRFTKSDGTSLLDYWIESSDSNSATVWVEFDQILASPTISTFHMYYGNAAAAAVSSVSTTLLTYASSGGTITTINGTQGPYTRIHTFLLADSGTNLVFSAANATVSALVVAGGGGGGRNNGSYAVTIGSMTITVGNGGNGVVSNYGQGGDGGSSSFGTITTTGGGGGGGSGSDNNNPGRNGGSGGGGGKGTGSPGGTGVVGPPRQGYDGGTGTGSWNGGGGAGEIGPANRGGNGLAYDITGSSVYYAGGGGAYYTTGGEGGLGGGGAGWGVSGTAGTGGGGGANACGGSCSSGSGSVLARVRSVAR